ncbi:MAG: hypothetical protein LUQ31_04415 [Methanoregula sp.]|nr:hypothetical protein [Methanoregula sp.]
MDRSPAIAALNVRSQPFLGYPSIRKQGWHAEYWRANDPVIEENLTQVHFSAEGSILSNPATLSIRFAENLMEDPDPETAIRESLKQYLFMRKHDLQSIEH